MSKLEIFTNNQPRDIICGFQMPKGQRKNFDYLNNEDYMNNQFVQYRGYYYDMNEFMSVNNNSDFKGWDGYSSDTYFSGVLIKICDDGDSVIMGRYFS